MYKTWEKLNLIAFFIATFITVAFSIGIEREVQAQPEPFFYIESKKIDRVEVLENFFEKYNSPLKENSETFVSIADEYNIDYRLLPSISCMESTCGKQLIPGTYNPFGWGIYGNQYIGFGSYDEAISVVGKGLAENYIAKGFETPWEIGPIYAPPNYANWASGVTFFYNQIDEVSRAI